MHHELHTTNPDDFSGQLTISQAPDGRLRFEDGVATVADRTVAEEISRRRPNIEYVGETDAPVAASAEGDAETLPEPPFDPGDYTVGDLREGLPADAMTTAELEAVIEAERAGADRTTAKEVLRDALEESED